MKYSSAFAKKSLLVLVVAFTVGCHNMYDNNEIKEPKEQYTYDSDFKRLVKNISVKEKGQNSITYEYKEVRVDEVGVLAARYCDETYGMPAHLKSIKLHKNNARLATFHCNDLQK